MYVCEVQCWELGQGGFGVDLFVPDVSFCGVAESGLRWWR